MKINFIVLGHIISLLYWWEEERECCVHLWLPNKRGWGGGGILLPGRPGFLTGQVWLWLAPSTGCPCVTAPEAANGLRRVWLVFEDKTLLFQNRSEGATWFRVGTTPGSVPPSLCPAPAKGQGPWVPGVEFLRSASSSCHSPVWELTCTIPKWNQSSYRGFGSV